MTDSSTNRPFKILGLKQVAIGAEKKADLETFFGKILGLEKVKEEKLEAENVFESTFRLADGVNIDLMEPVDLNKKPSVHKPPLHHIALRVDNIEAAHDWLKAQGVRIAGEGIRVGAGGKRIFFTHPKGDSDSPIGSHILLEFAEE